MTEENKTKKDLTQEEQTANNTDSEQLEKVEQNPVNTQPTDEVEVGKKQADAPLDPLSPVELTTVADASAPIVDKKSSNKWMKIAAILLVLSLCLAGANPLYQYFTTKKVKSELKEVKLKELAPYEPDASAEPEIDTSNKELYIGKMAIPAVKLALPIVKGSGEDNLFKGAATNTNNQELGKGNYSLSSHKMPYDEKLLFSPLLRVKMGDKIYLTEGKFAYEYKTTEIFVVSPDQIEILDEIPDKIVTTLYTCETDAGTERHVVRGELENIIPLAKLDSKIAKMLN